MIVDVLGTTYEIMVKKYEEDEAFARLHATGYCDIMSKTIVVCDMSTYPGREHDPESSLAIVVKESLRHEIVHAFFNESGLSDNAFIFDGSWATNEEMVDWFAIQGPKIYQAWLESGAV